MISNLNRTSSASPLRGAKDLETHIDRLNRALSLAMQEIEFHPSSRVSSRFSTIPIEAENRIESPSFRSEDLQLPYEFEQKIEELLLSVDRSQMIIEDFISEQARGLPNKLNFSESNEKCSHDLFHIRHEVELNLKLQRNKQLEKERQEFEEKLEALDRLNDLYSNKKAEVTNLFEKLTEKEKLLNEKEKELRASRIAFDRRKTIWEQEKGNKENDEMPNIKPNKYPAATTNPLRSSMPCTLAPSLTTLDSSSVLKNGAPAFQVTIKSCQSELSEKLEELEKLQKTKTDSSKLEMQIDSLKNKIATLRGEQVMMMSCQSSRILSSLVQTMQKQNTRDEIAWDRKEIIERINSSLKYEPKEVFKIKQLEVKMPEKTETKRRFLFSDAPTPKNILTPRTCEKEDPYKVYFENKKKMIQEKEMELAKKEKLLKDVFKEIIVKYPDAKEIIDSLKRRNRG